MPEVSVIIPTHNRPDLLPRALASLQAQTYRDFEVIVVDDASDDAEGVAAVAADMQAVLPSLTLIQLQQNGGVSHARNIGIRSAKGNWIGFVDDDDEWFANKLAVQMNVADSAPNDVGIITCDAERVVRKWPYNKARYCRYERDLSLHRILRKCPFPPCMALVRRTVFEHVGFFDEELRAAEDWDMWARIALDGYRVVGVDEVLARIHNHTHHSNHLTNTSGLIGYRQFVFKHRQSILRHTSLFTWLRFVKHLALRKR